MAGKNKVEDTLAEAAKVVDIWEANPGFVMGSVSLDSFKASMTTLEAASDTVESKRTELTGLMGNRDVQSQAMSDLVSRARSGVRATFGVDSTEYEQVGGTPRSKRKPAKRKAKVATA
jgi:hypothetical protein